MKSELHIDKKEKHLLIRPLKPADRPRLKNIIIASQRFSGEEVSTALELVDEALAKGEGSGYFFAVIEDQGMTPVVQGYACYGPTPLTDGVYDLYWIVVDPFTQGKGYGQRLLRFVEEEIVDRGGRMVLIETSSQESYNKTARFYERAGYKQVARIRNFYRIGDDKLIFSKDLI